MISELGYNLVDFITMILGPNPVANSTLYHKMGFVVFCIIFVTLIFVFIYFLISLFKIFKR